MGIESPHMTASRSIAARFVPETGLPVGAMPGETAGVLAFMDFRSGKRGGCVHPCHP
jgi:hypothetical protein